MEPIRVGDFSFTVQPGDPPNCVAVEKRWAPLAAALTAAGAALPDLIARRTGMNKEGVVGFYWDEERPGRVRARYLGEEVVVDEEFFAEAATAWLKARP